MITEIRVSFKYIEVSRSVSAGSLVFQMRLFESKTLNTISLYDVETISRFHVWFDCGAQNHFNSLSPSREWLAAPSNSQRLQPWILKITTCFLDTIEGCFIVWFLVNKLIFQTGVFYMTPWMLLAKQNRGQFSTARLQQQRLEFSLL